MDNKLQGAEAEAKGNALTLPQQIRSFADNIPHPEGLSMLGMSKDLIHGIADLLEGPKTGQMSPEGTMALLGLGTPGLLRKATPEVMGSIPGFYSKLEKAAGIGDFAQEAPLLQGKMTAKQYLAALRKVSVGQNELRDNPDVVARIASAGPEAKTAEEWSQLIHPDGNNSGVFYSTLAPAMEERVFGDTVLPPTKIRGQFIDIPNRDTFDRGTRPLHEAYKTKDLPNSANSYHEIAIEGQTYYQRGFVAPTPQEPETTNNNLQRQSEAIRANRPRLVPVPYNPFANLFIPVQKGT